MLDTEIPVDNRVKFSIGHMSLADVTEETHSACVVVVSHEDGGIFSYQTPGKGIHGDSAWVPTRLAKDIDNCGGQNVRVQVKSDQVPSIVNVQEELRFIRKAKTVCANSPVGESECNDRSGNAVKRIQVKFRTI